VILPSLHGAADVLRAVARPTRPTAKGVREKFSELWPAFQAKDCTKVMAVSEAMLKIDYTLFSVHTIRADCFKDAGRRRPLRPRRCRGARTVRVAQISGDGKTMKTAFVVVTMSEERLLLTFLGLKEERQSLLNGEERMYDLIEGPNEKADGPKSAFFDVSARSPAWRAGSRRQAEE